MKPLRILHLEDNALDAFFVRRVLEQNDLAAEIIPAATPEAFRAEIGRGHLDLVLCDSGLPGLSGDTAFQEVHQRWPNVPFIFVSGATDETQVNARLKNGAADVVVKGQPWQLASAIRRAVSLPATEWTPPNNARPKSMMRLVAAVQELSLARSLDAIRNIVRKAARELVGADGATFILRDGDQCHYFDEDAIAPLWKGQRFPMSRCISGWVMMNKQPAVIEDIYSDPRIPADAYRPTFVKSLVVVPIRVADPIGAIGNYWATHHRAAPEAVELLQALANTTAVAIENVQLYAELEQRVKDRTLQLQLANKELEAFSYSVSHDLRSPLRSISGFSQILTDEYADKLDDQAKRYFGRICSETERMNGLIDDLLRLSRFAGAELAQQPVDLSAIATEQIARLRTANPERNVEARIQPGLAVQGDPGLLRVVLENLLSNAWKYTSKRDAAVIEFGFQENTGDFYVRDNGAGFDQARVGKLFAPFQRLHRAEDFPGSGIGLATVQRIIHKHGGRIRAEGETGKGATFFFTLPHHISSP